MSDRDPRIHPRPRDILRREAVTTTVTSLSPRKVHFRNLWADGMTTAGSLFFGDWRKMVACAEVVHAEDCPFWRDAQKAAARPMNAPLLHLTSAALLDDRCPVCNVGRVLVGRNGDAGLHGCRAAEEDACHQDAPAAYDHARAAEVFRPATLAAMAQPPRWLLPYTLGRPAWSYAVGPIVPLMWAAIGERRKTGSMGPAAEAYRAAMDARWARCVELGRFAPGAWGWMPHGAEGDGLVPADATLVCTCRPAQGCHLRWLAPHLVAAGWSVQLYGEALS